MNNLILDISSIRKNCESTKGAISKYKENISSYFTGLGNVDTAWKDYNTETFVEKVNKDKSSYLDHISVMNKSIKIIEDFCEDLEDVISLNLNVSKLKNIRYIPQSTQYAKDALNECKKGINNLNNKFSTMNVPVDCIYASAIKGMMNDINANKLENLKYKIDSTISGINDSIKTAKDANDSISNAEIDTNILNFRYKTVRSEGLKRYIDEREKASYVYSNIVNSTLGRTDLDLEKIRNANNNINQTLIKEDDTRVSDYNKNLESNILVSSPKENEVKINELTKNVNEVNSLDINEDILINVNDNSHANELTRNSSINNADIFVSSSNEANRNNINTAVQNNVSVNKSTDSVFNDSIFSEAKRVEANVNERTEANKETLETLFEQTDINVNTSSELLSENINTNIRNSDIHLSKSNGVNTENVTTSINDVEGISTPNHPLEEIINE